MNQNNVLIYMFLFLARAKQMRCLLCHLPREAGSTLTTRLKKFVDTSTAREMLCTPKENTNWRQDASRGPSGSWMTQNWGTMKRNEGESLKAHPKWQPIKDTCFIWNTSCASNLRNYQSKGFKVFSPMLLFHEKISRVEGRDQTA